MRLNRSWTVGRRGGRAPAARCWGWGILGLVLCEAVLQAQPHAFNIQGWQIEDGLPQNSVTSIVQTPDGYLWLATFNGLARFDGARFTVFDEGNTSMLQSSRLVRLDVDTDGALWIITEDGALSRYRDGQFTSYTAPESLPAAGAAALVRGPGGCLLLLDRAGCVSHLAHEKWILDPLTTFLRGQRISICADHQDRLWVWSWDTRAFGPVVGKEVAAITGPDGAKRAEVRAYAPATHGGFWVVLGERIWRYDHGRLEWISTPWQVPASVHGLTHMLEDRRGNVWLGTYGKGLFRFDPSGQRECWTTADGLGHDAVRALLEDREGNIWVGTDGGGFSRLKPRLIHTLDGGHGVTAQVVMSVVQDRHDPTVLWAGLNGGGVNRLQNDRATPLLGEPWLRTNTFVYGVFSDARGLLWIGTYDDGILRSANGQISRLPGTERWAGRPLLSGLEDQKGTVWLGGGFGLFQWREDRLIDLNAQVGWTNVVVRALAENLAGDIFVGSFGRGLLRLQGGAWSQFLEKDGLADNHISALFVDRDQTLWLGTFNGGLSRFKDGRFANLTMAEGLPANCISSILEDSDGNLWLGSNRGIIRLPKAQVAQLMAGQRRRIAGYTCGLDDGLSTLECGGGAHPAACPSPDGRLWFGTVKGLAVVDPHQLPFNPLPPPVVIEDVVADERQVLTSPWQERAGVGSSRPALGPHTPPARGLIVAPGKHRLEFRFTGLSLVAPEKVQFRYRLLGLEEGWVEGGSVRSAFYPYIPPGTYRFEVTACNNDGIWNPAGAALGLVVLPPWWMTWWFRTGAVLGAAGLIFWLAELRLRRLRHERSLQAAFAQRLIGSQEEERKRIAAGLHDSLGQNLLVIKNRALLGLRGDAGQGRPEEQLEEISKVATQSIEDVREISRNLRPYQIDRLGLTKAIEAMVTGVSRSSGLACVVEMEPVDGLLHSSSEIHLYRIIQEVLNNVLKHSQAAQARISLKREDARLLLRVEDDGCGFDYAAALARPARDHGLGLTDIAERVRILGGKLQCDSGRGEGTRWQVEIPIGTPTK